MNTLLISTSLKFVIGKNSGVHSRVQVICIHNEQSLLSLRCGMCVYNKLIVGEK
jgi:hypothetical protein